LTCFELDSLREFNDFSEIHSQLTSSHCAYIARRVSIALVAETLWNSSPTSTTFQAALSSRLLSNIAFNATFVTFADALIAFNAAFVTFLSNVSLLSNVHNVKRPLSQRAAIASSSTNSQRFTSC
jgi:chromate transport protein ChrA